MAESGKEALRDEELIRKARLQDETAVGILLTKYKPLVLKLSRARFIAGGDRDDLLQEGMIGLYQAIRSYDPEREAGFATFAALCIDRQMMKAIDSSQRVKNQPLNNSVDLASLDGDGHEQVTSESPEKIVLAKTSYDETLHMLMSRLGPLEKQVLTLYLEGLGYRDIGTVLNKSPKAVDNAIQRIRKKAAALK